MQFNKQYSKKKVLVTGHTGFKGSWLVRWLEIMGATVFGYSLPPSTDPNHYNILKIDIDEKIDDISDQNSFCNFVKEIKPDIVFHLAAQPLVRESYRNPFNTYKFNIMGTVSVLEAIRLSNSVQAAVIITTDKCYDNKEWLWGYRENDRLGGFDPYSSSKACAEIVVDSYRNSFLNDDVLIATCRAGNVIGGGDWSKDRLIPDIIKSTLNNQKVTLRNPNAIRPWQHVLESLSGYLLVGQKLLERDFIAADAWNLGPSADSDISVREMVVKAKKEWGNISYDIVPDTSLHEANNLMLDCSKVRTLLNWEPIWDSADMAIEHTIRWYREFYENKNVETESQIAEYINAASRQNACWVD